MARIALSESTGASVQAAGSIATRGSGKRAQSYPRGLHFGAARCAGNFQIGPAQASAHSMSPVCMREDRETAEAGDRGGEG
jgi:hypothetical protein